MGMGQTNGWTDEQIAALLDAPLRATLRQLKVVELNWRVTYPPHLRPRAMSADFSRSRPKDASSCTQQTR